MTVLPKELNTVIQFTMVGEDFAHPRVLLSDGWHAFSPTFFSEEVSTAERVALAVAFTGGFRVLYPVPEETK